MQEAAEDVSAVGSKAGSGVSGAFDSAGRSIKGAAHNVQDKVSGAADKVRTRTWFIVASLQIPPACGFAANYTAGGSLSVGRCSYQTA